MSSCRVKLTPIPLGFLALFALAGSVEAQTPSFSSAQFAADSQLAHMGFSQRDLGRDKNTISIQCQGFVEIDGKLTQSYCFPPNIFEDQRVTKKIVRALQDETFNTAKVNGTPVRVLMSFTVSVDCTGEACGVVTAPHHGFSLEEYGSDYIAPQPVLSGNDWYTGFADKLEWIDAWMPNLSRSLNHNFWPLRPLIAVEVQADGSASAGCIYFLRGAGDDREERNRRKLEQALSNIGAIRYIPGFDDGRPVAMRFFEPSVFRDAAQKVSARRLFDQGGQISNRFYPRQLANRTEAPELYCAR